MRALVVGGDGFVGRWLVRHLAASGDEVHAVVGPRFEPPLDEAREVHRADVRAYEPIADVVARSRPEAVYYLAAVSQAGGRERVEMAARIGLVGAIHTLAACSALDAPLRFLHVSSAHVYGGGDDPLTEESPVDPAGVYGAAKAASERAVLTLAAATDVDVVVARPFNHIGPGQAASFVVPSLVERIRAVRRGEASTIPVGSLEMVRDFTDVRDVVRAYRLLALSGRTGDVYNVASGEGIAVRELVDTVLELAGVEADVVVDRTLARSGERPIMVGDARRLEALGWTRTYRLRDTLAEILEADGV